MPGEGGGHMFRASHDTHFHAANSIRPTELELNCKIKHNLNEWGTKKNYLGEWLFCKNMPCTGSHILKLFKIICIQKFPPKIKKLMFCTRTQGRHTWGGVVRMILNVISTEGNTRALNFRAQDSPYFYILEIHQLVMKNYK